MVKNKYAKGAAFERGVVLFLREREFGYVCRSAGSKGVADIVAVTSSGKAWLIQCKAGDGKMTHRDKCELFKVAQGCGAIAVVCVPAPKEWSGKYRFTLLKETVNARVVEMLLADLSVGGGA